MRGRLAHERHRAARCEHAVELRQRLVQAGQVVQHGVSEHEVERFVRERQRLGVGLPGLDLDAQLLRRLRPGARSMPGEMSVATACSDHALAQQVELK